MKFAERMKIKEKISAIESEIENTSIDSLEKLEEFRLAHLSKKGSIQSLFGAFRDVSLEEKKELGQLLNELKVKAQSKFYELKSGLESGNSKESGELDLTRPAAPDKLGSRHPISLIQNRIIEIFSRIGFSISEGPEIEDDWHNFSALNMPD